MAAPCTHSEYSHWIWDTSPSACKGVTDFTSTLGAFRFAQLPKEEQHSPIDSDVKEKELVSFFWNHGEGNENHATHTHFLCPAGTLDLPGEPGERQPLPPCTKAERIHPVARDPSSPRVFGSHEPSQMTLAVTLQGSSSGLLSWVAPPPPPGTIFAPGQM